VDLLQQLEDWLENEQGQRVFWLNGLAGTGKSTIAQTFAEITFAEGKLGASFFCFRDFEDRSNIQPIFPTLAYQLACQYPPFQEELLQVLKKFGTKCRSLCSQLETLIVGPFQALQTPTLIIIDALDECRDEEPVSAILSVLSCYVRSPLSSSSSLEDLNLASGLDSAWSYFGLTQKCSDSMILSLIWWTVTSSSS